MRGCFFIKDLSLQEPRGSYEPHDSGRILGDRGIFHGLPTARNRKHGISAFRNGCAPHDSGENGNRTEKM